MLEDGTVKDPESDILLIMKGEFMAEVTMNVKEIGQTQERKQQNQRFLKSHNEDIQPK